MYTILEFAYAPGLDISNITFELWFPGDKRIQSVFESDSTYDLWKKTWVYLAQSLSDLNSIAGYELIDEPCMPSSKSGTMTDFMKKYGSLVSAIRAVDPGRVCIIPQFNCREAEPGETYRLGDTEIVDKGEQGIVWQTVPCVLPDTFAGITYTFHFYEPWEFTAEGTALSFNADSMKKYINDQISQY